jgi:hypothetical protein
MANKKISDLPSLTGANSVSADLIPVVDVSADITSSMTRGQFFLNVPSLTVAGAASITGATTITGLFSSSNVAITGGTIADTTFTNVTITGGTISGITDIAVADGGTGISTYTIGDILYASGTGTLAKLADVATGNVLLSGGVGVAPAYGKVDLTTHVATASKLPVANGGTGAATLTGYVKGSGTSVMTAATTIPNTDITGLGTMSTQAANAVAITGGTINGATIGATTAASVKGTSLTSTSVITDSLVTKTAGTLALAFATNGIVQVTPNATGTFTTTVPPAGTRTTLIVLTAGTTTYTMTFGTGFKTTGTLATGAVAARYYIFQFVSDGTSLLEMSRTTALALA